MKTDYRSLVRKPVVSKNAVKHGLLGHENIIKCEKQSILNEFRKELLSGPTHDLDVLKK